MPLPPLAYRMRPKTLNEYVGQNHILGEGQILSRMLAAQKIVSIILCGDPGIGKTTLAQLIADITQCHFVQLSAVNAGVKDIKETIQHARENQKHQQGTLLFIDEIHRFNKTQQDSLLPNIENGLITLIGATTENPFFAINNALLSRLTTLRLKPLTLDDIKLVLMRAIKKDQILTAVDVVISDEVISDIYHYSSGDCRKALNILESMTLIAAQSNNQIKLTSALLDTVIGECGHKMDNKGDYFYDQLSAFHKSIRGSDPDAAIFWLANMIEAGVDPAVIARRMLCIASEDIGNADPRALTIALDAWQSYERLGLPEGQLPLSQAALYLASVPKSNAAYLAYKNVTKDLASHTHIDVPLHLRNIHPAGKKKGAPYQYPHNYPNAYVLQQYLPNGINSQYYFPSEYGLERKIKQRLMSLKNKV